MTLGENISTLRGRRNLSQGDLADQLDVSRQSVSKWETNASVPELDKLIRLSQIFGISLDELVSGAPSQQAASATPVSPEPSAPAEGIQGWKVGGLCFLGLGCILILLLTLIGSLAFGLIFALPFLLCAALCLVLKRRYVALVCSWALWGLVMAYFWNATGIRPWWVFSFWLYRPGLEIHVLLAWAEVLTFLALAFSTALSVMRPGKPGK